MYKNLKSPAFERGFLSLKLRIIPTLPLVGTISSGPLFTYKDYINPENQEADMSIEQQAMNDAMQNKNIADDPSWTYQERQKYQAAYAGAKQKLTDEMH